MTHILEIQRLSCRSRSPSQPTNRGRKQRGFVSSSHYLSFFSLYFSNGPQKTTPLESVQPQPQSDDVDFSSAPMGRTHPVTQRNEALMSCRDHLRCLRLQLAAVGRLVGRQATLLPSRSADHRIPVSNTRLSALIPECRLGAALEARNLGLRLLCDVVVRCLPRSRELIPVLIIPPADLRRLPLNLFELGRVVYLCFLHT